MAKNTAFFFDEYCLWHSTGQHALVFPVGGWVQPPAASGYAESPESKRRFKNLLDVSGLSAAITTVSAPCATEQELRLVHTNSYLEEFKAVSDAGGGKFADNEPVGPGTYEISKLSAGLAIAAVEAVYTGKYDNAYSLSRPPGHHCLPDKSMGFCYLANIAIAIEVVKKRHKLGKVVVIDWDVHHGNGTQAIFSNRSDVLTISVHQQNCFPPGCPESGVQARGEGEGFGYNINIPLFAGGGNDAYMYAFDEIVLPALQAYKPEMIIVACGYDANCFDPLARMQLYSESYRALANKVKQAAEQLCAGKLVLVHEGGYAESYVPFCGLATMEAISEINTKVTDPMLDFIKLQQPDQQVCQFQRQYIDQWARELLFELDKQ